jgi:hypothetical protein
VQKLPRIFMCHPEEPSYFVDPDQLRRIYPEIWDLGYWRSEDNYLKLFESAPNADIIGESSTNYTKRPLIRNVPEKIGKFNPSAKLIYIMRSCRTHYQSLLAYGQVSHRKAADIGCHKKRSPLS